jgi:hypothetical protein
MGKEEMLTTQQIADELGVAYQTVMAWLYKGFFPNAQKEDTPRGPYYLVPRSDLRTFKAPKRGRPSKSETQAETATPDVGHHGSENKTADQDAEEIEAKPMPMKKSRKSSKKMMGKKGSKKK